MKFLLEAFCAFSAFTFSVFTDGLYLIAEKGQTLRQLKHLIQEELSTTFSFEFMHSALQTDSQIPQDVQLNLSISILYNDRFEKMPRKVPKGQIELQ